MRTISIIVLLASWLAISASASPGLHTKAPGFSLPDRTGTMVSLAAVVGPQRKSGAQGAVLNFFASWCVACRRELPILDSLAGEWRAKGVTVFLIDVKEAPAAANALLGELHIGKSLVLLDRDGTVQDLYGVRFLPVTFFIDAEGIVRDVIYGGVSDARELRAGVDKILP